jgi:YebC/PmpR family DNA-binding regulatory protein
MAGHSRWANIKHKKAVSDFRRGKLFTKLLKEITVAVKEGGGAAPDANPRLRLAIQNARGANIPKDTIERAINKGKGETASFTELTYEGYAAGGVGVYVECTSDNAQRTVQNVRAAFSKYGGSLGKNGSLEFIFQRKSVFEFAFTSNLSEDELMLELIEAGADEININEGQVRVEAALEDFGNIQKKLEHLGIEPEAAGLQRIATTFKEVDNETLPKVLKLLEVLDDDDDVQRVFHNLMPTEEQLDQWDE